MTEEKEEKTLTFSQRVVNAQAELKAPKGQFNNFGKYKYRSAEDILEAVKPINLKHGLLLTITDDIKNIGDRYYINATATLSDVDSDEGISVKAFAREPLNKKGQDESQITGTASSYARKYALNGLYLIDDTKDADTDEHRIAQDNVKPATKTQMTTLTKLAKDVAELYQLDIEVMKDKMGIFDDMSADDYGNALLRLKDAKEKKEKEGK